MIRRTAGRQRIARAKKVLIFGLVLALFSTIAAIYYKPTRLIPATETKATDQTSTVPVNTISSMTGRYLFNGTIFWARGVEEWSKRPDGTYDYTHPFNGLSTFGRDQYDGWIADLECPITTQAISFRDQINTLQFNCMPTYTKEAAKYFSIVDLANNHSDNRGAAGLLETRQHLDEAGIQYFGHYDPSLLDDICKVIPLPVRLQKSDKSEQKGTLPVAFCAWHYFYRLPRPGEIETMQKYAAVMPVFAFVHMGAEYNTSAQQVQRDIAHTVADQGPVFVIANNPHWIQDSEAYKGKLIVYSTGNFIFDQYDSEGTRSASIDMTMTLPYSDNLQKWLDLGEQCKKTQSSCFQKIIDANLTKPQLAVSYDVVAGDNSGHLTKKGSADLLLQIKQRLGWEQTLKGLSEKP